jgi:hypothetical protein
MGMKIPGYFTVRVSNGVVNELFVRTVVFDNGIKRAAIIMCDALKITNRGFRALKEKLSERCGVAAECVYLHGTHTHTSAAIDDPEDVLESEKAFFLWQQNQIIDAVTEAVSDLAPCYLSVAKGIAEGVGFLRRYRYADGRTKTNPPYADPGLIGHDGTMDDSVQIIRIQREGTKEIVIANFGTHPDTLGGTKYYTDWPGLVVDQIKHCLNHSVEALFLNGCQGNAGAANRLLPKKSKKKNVDTSQRMARIITGEILKIYDDATPIDGATISGHVVTATVGMNPHDPDEVPIAHEVANLYKEIKTYKDPIFAEYREKHNMSIPKARRIINNLNRTEPYQIPIYGLRVGSLAFIGFSGEPFTEIGLEIKKDSQMAMTITTCCTNGANGYFPTYEAFQGEGYERSTSKFAHNVANVLIDCAKAILNQMLID